jgi:peptidoglycan-associated lipoprotein
MKSPIKSPMTALKTSPAQRSLLIAALLATLAGCGTTKLADSTPPPVESRSPVPTTTAAPATPATANATPQSRVATVDLAGKPGGAGMAGAAGGGDSSAAKAASTAALAFPSQRVVYFDFDSFVVKDEFKGLVEGYAKVLGNNRSKKLALEGHTDERGGREYNLALGQKRAEAVVRTLTLLGASDGQLEAVSFGKERPADPGHDEDAWAKNRRVELKDR